MKRSSFTEIILMRHGETPWTAQRRYTGSSDPSLSVRGRKQARALARYLKKNGADVLYSSSLKRARETAAIIGRSLKKRPRTDRRLNEISFGNWEGKTADELLLRKDKRFLAWCRGRPVSAPGGESRRNFRRRVLQALREIQRRYPGKKIGIVSHGGAMRMMLLELLCLPPKAIWSFRMDPASVTVIRLYGKTPQCVRLNDVPRTKAR